MNIIMSLSQQSMHTMEHMLWDGRRYGWSPWDGCHDMGAVGWSPYDDHHGMVVVVWAPSDSHRMMSTVRLGPCDGCNGLVVWALCDGCRGMVAMGWLSWYGRRGMVAV